MNRIALSDPLETVLSWVWALGTAAGLTVLGLIAHSEHDTGHTLTAAPALSADDADPDEGGL
ncbi:hypothetical protein [Streptomyces sp. NPDC090021]|uniref:hypothetical protein n=1 Tax=Streptomyces sp. NPDC090021 TaxID=3365919 RepID=UPI0037F1C636